MSASADSPESLRRLQKWFFDALVHPEQTEGCEDLLLGSAERGARARLAVYQRSYLLRLQKCLAEQFPALCHALGEGLFADFAREYLRDRPSRSHSLYDLGNDFPAWLEAHRPDSDQPPERREAWIDFMVDLATYEHAVFRLYDAPGHEGRPWPGTDVDDARLVLQPCFALVRSRYPVAWYYHEVRRGRSPEPPPRRDEPVAIVRKDHLVSTFPITAPHFDFLTTLARSGDLPAALAQMAQAAGRSLSQVERSWRHHVRGPWIEGGFFVEAGEQQPVSPARSSD